MTQEVVVVMGPSQHGKSTFIELAVLDTVSVATGDGSGKSCTEKPALYSNTRIGPLLDTPGYNDTECRFNNTAAGHMVAGLLIEHGIEEVKFILVNSLVDMAASLPSTLKEFNLVFPNAMQSALVLATQVDKVNPPDEVPKKWENLKQRCRHSGIATQLQWQSYKDSYKNPLEKSDLDDRFGCLKDRLTKLPSYKPKKAGDLEQRIQEKMKQLQKEAGNLQQEQTQDFEEQYMEDVSDYEDVPVPHTVAEFKTVTERVPFPKTVWMDVEEPCTAWTVPYVNIPIKGTQKKKVPVSELQWEEVSRQIPVINCKTEWIKKRVTKQKLNTRTIQKTVTVEVDVPLESFRAAAKQIILDENENQIKDLIQNARSLQDDG